VITIHQQNATITFREVGSTLVTKWPSYYAEANVIMVSPQTTHLGKPTHFLTRPKG
jgi:hypothetical protein